MTTRMGLTDCPSIHSRPIRDGRHRQQGVLAAHPADTQAEGMKVIPHLAARVTPAAASAIVQSHQLMPPAQGPCIGTAGTLQSTPPPPGQRPVVRRRHLTNVVAEVGLVAVWLGGGSVLSLGAALLLLFRAFLCAAVS